MDGQDRLMAQTRMGALKVRAAQLGMSCSEYEARCRTEKWCTRCKEWHQRSAFGADRSRFDGLSSSCIASRKAHYDRTYVSTGPGVNPLTGRPGPAPAAARDGDKVQARQRINVEVRTGQRPRPSDLPCADCGHVWSEGQRRHEYDHYLGYAPEHHLDVEPVCTVCHGRRGRERGEIVQHRGRRGRFDSRKENSDG